MNGLVNLLSVTQNFLSQAVNGGLVLKQLLGFLLHPVRSRGPFLWLRKNVVREVGMYE